jgi:uncharacterized SAM-binding protein YcdF (DUF218 family)
MRDELAMRGVARSRVMFEEQGRHTRDQAVNCFRLLKGEKQPCVLLVSSPAHIRRSVWAFEKAGFTNVAAVAAFDGEYETDLRFETPELKGRAVPDVGQSLLVRYGLWANLATEAQVLREYSAMLYYKAFGWI